MASDFFYLTLEFMDLLIHQVWVGAVMDITPSLVGTTMELTIIKSFPKIPVMQLVVQMITVISTFLMGSVIGTCHLLAWYSVFLTRTAGS